MTTDLRDRLDDLVAEVPDHVTADPRAAWGAGARRRTRRRVGLVAAVAALAVAGGLAVLGVRPPGLQPADTPGAGATAYPTRIDNTIRTRDVDDTDGPVAGVMEVNGGWSAVAVDGGVFRLFGAEATAYLASVSPDGLKVSYLSTAHGMSDWTVVDLQADLAYSGFASGDVESGESWVMGAGFQAYWSPDSSRLLLPVQAGTVLRDNRNVAALVVPLGEAAQRVRRPRGISREWPPTQLVGWAGPDTIGWLRWDASDPVLLVTRKDGTIVKTLHLDPPADGEITRATLSPAGDGRLAVNTAGHVLEYDADGRLVSETPHPTGALVFCPVSWGPTGPYVPVQTSRDAVLLAVDGSPLVQAAPELQAGCSIWALDALSGTADRGIGARLFGRSDAWLSWHWWQIGLDALVLLAAAAAFVVGRRRRRT